MPKKTISEELISTARAAELLGVIPRRVQALVAEGRLVPVMTVGRSFLFRRGDVDGFQRLKRGPKKAANAQVTRKECEPALV